MSEYQYYEFQAIDRPLSKADQQALRALSTRARITATSFTNSYEWGDFKGDPAKLMDRCFDLHLYLANWGTRRLMIRLPKRLVDAQHLNELLRKVDCAELRGSGENLVLDIQRDEEEFEDWNDGSGWLAALALLRADVLQGDLRLFYLLWLTRAQGDAFEADELEPMPGIGPMTASLEAFADFFGLDPDLVQVAAERSATANASAMSPDAVRKVIAAMSDREKIAMLVRLFEGDPHAAIELRNVVFDRLRPDSGTPPLTARTVGELRARASVIRLARERDEADKATAERQRQAKQAEKARQARLDAIARRGDSVWREIETEIERRNVAGYDKAVALLSDLRAIAEERGRITDFARRLRAMRERHAQKKRFMERLAGMG
ncbi:MAG: hypothetical protein ACLQU2_12585 [Candidatus Binataceae bacterium]